MCPKGPEIFSILAITLCAVIFGMTPADATPLADACAGPFVDATSETTQWTVPGEKTCFSTYFDDKTLWFVRAAGDVLGGEVALGLPTCSRGGDTRVLERSLDSLLLEVRGAGWRSVCFEQTDPAAEPVAVRLVSKALASSRSQDPHEDDPDPDPLVAGGDCGRVVASKSQDRHEDDPDPDPLTSGGECDRLAALKSQDPHEDDPDPDPLTSGGECVRVTASRSQDPHEDDPDPDPMTDGGECVRVAASRSQDPHEDDPDPDPMTDGGECVRVAASRSQDPHEDDPDPDPMTDGGECVRVATVKSQDPHEDDPDPDPMTDGGFADTIALHKACAVAGAWGRLHMPACADRLSAGEWIEASTGRFVRIDVAGWQRLEVEAAGLTSVAVRDVRGHRLERGEMAGRGSLAVGLAPGIYWLEVEGGAVRYSLSSF
ncbi:MAG: hypothetical protein AAGM22_26465 [Acidobacteriota bacterium]